MYKKHFKAFSEDDDDSSAKHYKTYKFRNKVDANKRRQQR